MGRSLALGTFCCCLLLAMIVGGAPTICKGITLAAAWVSMGDFWLAVLRNRRRRRGRS